MLNGVSEFPELMILVTFSGCAPPAPGLWFHDGLARPERHLCDFGIGSSTGEDDIRLPGTQKLVSLQLSSCHRPTI